MTFIFISAKLLLSLRSQNLCVCLRSRFLTNSAISSLIGGGSAGDVALTQFAISSHWVPSSMFSSGILSMICKGLEVVGFNFVRIDLLQIRIL